jgi:hypothetical protein
VIGQHGEPSPGDRNGGSTQDRGLSSRSSRASRTSNVCWGILIDDVGFRARRAMIGALPEIPQIPPRGPWQNPSA